MSSQNLTDEFKINLNQNLWGLLITSAALGLSEHYHLGTLYWISVIAASAMTLSVLITTTAYTLNYWRAKLG